MLALRIQDPPDRGHAEAGRTEGDATSTALAHDDKPGNGEPPADVEHWTVERLEVERVSIR